MRTHRRSDALVPKVRKVASIKYSVDRSLDRSMDRSLDRSVDRSLIPHYFYRVSYDGDSPDCANSTANLSIITVKERYMERSKERSTGRSVDRSLRPHDFYRVSYDEDSPDSANPPANRSIIYCFQFFNSNTPVSSIDIWPLFDNWFHSSSVYS